MRVNTGEPEIDIPEDKQRFVNSLGIHGKIYHPKYVSGQIIEILGEEENTEFVVIFEDGQRSKRLLAYHAPIKRWIQA